ncbi:DNA repair protein RecO [Croceicoccus naphthovorans]|uniref:DNA recombination protein RecO n=1 Tax=Croceicoccus naphthovorans TaxID=1348774 RepID=A0A0G3XEH1_9SPHN|nr:recombination protein O N-terminal domain-containing protein [Croceicoccus naphthovorans]AKM09567.1 DNA recombination protein RecO [Croceicoccus naphthovorans]MBB3989666.1 DNA repair protein RecO (recombination protein O) [Croceicoccus naphthovorans]
MQIRAPAIVCASRPHGETAAIARVLTREYGLLAGYVAGARGRKLRPVLIPGNLVSADLAARSASQLPFLKLELVQSRGPWLTEPLPASAIQWATTLAATVLPEHNPYPALHDTLNALLEAICNAPSARGWALAMAKFETLVMRDLGYGGDMPPMAGDWAAIMDVLERSGRQLSRRLLADRRTNVMGARELMMQRLARIAG